MKLSFIALFLCLSPIFLSTSTAAEEEGSLKERPHNLRARVLEASDIPVVDITALVGDVQKYKDEDEENQKNNPIGGIPWRVAARVNVNIKKKTHGITEILPDGTELWRVRVKSDNALFLSFDFANIKLDDNEELRFYAVDQNGDLVGDAIAGPFTKKNNNDDGLFGSPTIKGNNVVIEYENKDGSKGNNGNPFVINKVMHGYRNFQDDDQSTRQLRELQSPGSHCSPDIACPQGDNWRDDARSVAKIYFKGYICTGQMIATTNSNDCTPYFLTARHCISRSKTASVTTFYWNYNKPTCDGGSASSSQQSSGASLLFSSSGSDVSLLQLNQVPDPAYSVYYAGWDASPTAATSAVCIHHPSGWPKKISFDNDPVVTGSTSGGWGTDHWRVNGWETGTTLGGSSGSGLWNQNTHRIVGQLHGGTADCSGGWDEYGKFDVSWQNGLSSFLDPSNTGNLVADGHGACGVAPQCVADNDCNFVECQTAVCNAGNCEYSNESDDTSCSGGVCCGGSCAVPACSVTADCADNNDCTEGETCNSPGTCNANCIFSSKADNTVCSGGVCCGGSCAVPACSGSDDCNGNTCASPDSCTAQCQCGEKGATCGGPSECCNGKCRGGRCK